ncbi:MAG: carboxynorspermidine decarboxylase [Anaerovibrio sp.]|uniref:carboxynorspermidine decarboxylase n=1 Tax=Anaerovibrio sp. TaxID=1872532 RepID=UPI0025CBFB36|nr:carboxynorspermidine decarboxylase [Anaerovibrio sp.]MCR5175716.1 carboxynorspermidine decarboxylase [Anaerovibrio sp.]
MGHDYQPGWLSSVPSPAYVVEESRLRHNLEILKGLQDRTGCRVLLAQKAFSMYHFYPLMREFLKGTAASGLFEARLGHEEFGGENHVFSPAYQDKDFPEILDICDHIIFNSIGQLKHFAPMAAKAGRSYGLRINPEHSTQPAEHAIYDPCSGDSRLGTKLSELEEAIAEDGDGQFMYGIRGLHFHTLCEQGAEPLAETLEAVEQKFGKILKGLEWINFGGGHHITREDYNIDLLEQCIRRMQQQYGLTVYLEPGEAVALDAGFLVATVLELIEADDVNGRKASIGIMDTSAACHMPDVLEMPYRPPLLGAGEPGEKAFNYTLAGPTCLAGDTIGEYSFDAPLSVGDRLLFGDMAIYTMVKNNTFNGMPLPAICAVDNNGKVKIIREFGYEDFKMRL